jgi:hypothetical protein
MAETQLDRRALKQALKDAVAETLRDERGLLREVVTEALEDFALAEAIRQGRKTDPVSRDAVFRTLRGKR